MSRDEIQLLLDTAAPFQEISRRDIKKVPPLRGRTVVNLFLEPSTRTRSSFEIAERRLSADSISLAGSGSSVSKGESLLDTARTLDAMSPDLIVLRHGASGASDFLARHTRASVVNAGDGTNEHPTQALVDALTIRDHKDRLTGLKVAIVGDLLHSRVLRSNLALLATMGNEVRVSGPATLVPPGLAAMGAIVCATMDEAINGVDVIMMLRVQKERQSSPFLAGEREYYSRFGLDAARLRLAAKDAIVMHPGPMNRGVEIASEVADGARSVILQQVTNGVAIRMAVLYLLIGGQGDDVAEASD